TPIRWTFPDDAGKSFFKRHHLGAALIRISLRAIHRRLHVGAAALVRISLRAARSGHLALSPFCFAATGHHRVTGERRRGQIAQAQQTAAPPAAPQTGPQTGTERRQKRRTARVERRQKRRTARVEGRQKRYAERRTGRAERRKLRTGDEEKKY